MHHRTLLLTALLALILLGVGSTDYFLRERPHEQDVIAHEEPPGSPSGVAKGVSRRRQADVGAVLSANGYLKQETREVSFLRLTAPGSERVETMILLKNNDRAALFAWLDSTDAKDIFANLKVNLQKSFSPQLTDLVDVTAQVEGGPVVNTLAFSDPSLSPEKLIFLRARTRLYEFHIPKGSEDAISGLIEALVKG